MGTGQKQSGKFMDMTTARDGITARHGVPLQGTHLFHRLQKTKRASAQLAVLPIGDRNLLLRDVATVIKKSSAKILAANKKDLANFKGDESVAARLRLDDKKIHGIISS